jgi:hypothetical protein
MCCCTSVRSYGVAPTVFTALLLYCCLFSLQFGALRLSVIWRLSPLTESNKTSKRLQTESFGVVVCSGKSPGPKGSIQKKGIIVQKLCIFLAKMPEGGIHDAHSARQLHAHFQVPRLWALLCKSCISFCSINMLLCRACAQQANCAQSASSA